MIYLSALEQMLWSELQTSLSMFLRHRISCAQKNSPWATHYQKSKGQHSIHLSFCWRFPLLKKTHSFTSILEIWGPSNYLWFQPHILTVCCGVSQVPLPYKAQLDFPCYPSTLTFPITHSTQKTYQKGPSTNKTLRELKKFFFKKHIQHYTWGKNGTLLLSINFQNICWCIERMKSPDSGV